MMTDDDERSMRELTDAMRRHMAEEDEWRPGVEKKLDAQGKRMEEHHRILVGTDDEPGIAPIVREMHKILVGSRFTMKVLIWIAGFVIAVAGMKTWWTANVATFTLK